MMRYALGAACVGLVAWIVGLSLEPRQASLSLLVAFSWLASTAVGALILLMSFHAARSEWPIALRRLLESVVSILPLLFVFAAPALAGRGPLLLLKAVLYIGSWVVLAELLRGWSLRQDRDGDAGWTAKAYALSAGGLLIVAFTLTFASFDWLMALTPGWKSSIFGVYVFAGGFVAAFAVLVILARASLPKVATQGHFLSLGKYLFTFTIFWAYIMFDQFFIMWIADVPAEATWWEPRMGGWGTFTLALVFAQFVLPFFILLSRSFKTRASPLAALSLWILVAHYFDAYWLVAPALSPEGPRFSWLDPVCLLLVLGSSVAFGLFRARRHALTPQRDVRLAASLAYEGS